MSEKISGAAVVKRLAPCWIISFVTCYMLFVYEPLMMYATNKNDFWFDFGIMIAPVMAYFAIFFIGSAAVLTGLFFLCRRFSEKVTVYNIVLLVIFAAFTVLYIQGNFLSGSLPALDGSAIDWGVYGTRDIITAVICAVISAGLIFAAIKLGLSDLVSYAAGISVAVFAVLTVSLATTAAQNNMFQVKNNFISTNEDLNGSSETKNFYIFMVDSQSASEFSQVLSEKEEFSRAFDDFTFYPDTLSVYAYTRDSVPFVLSGHLNKNEREFGDYSARALNDSLLFKELRMRNYDIYLYGNEIAWYGEKGFDIKNNPGYDNVCLDYGNFFLQEMRFVWFKYLPYGLKCFSGIEKMDFGNNIDKFNWRNDVLYKEFGENTLQKTDNAQFRFIHAEGAHVPLDMDENMNRIEGGTYLQKTTATAKLISAFIECLKENGVYDNSVIVIMADHGYQPAQNKPDNYILSRFNPILLIKGIDEKHEFSISGKPVSYLDLPQAYTDLLNGKQSAELFPDAEYPRTRTVIWYEIYKEEHMEEYVTDGKATEWDKFRKTSVEFDLSKS